MAKSLEKTFWGKLWIFVEGILISPVKLCYWNNMEINADLTLKFDNLTLKNNLVQHKIHNKRILIILTHIFESNQVYSGQLTPV